MKDKLSHNPQLRIKSLMINRLGIEEIEMLDSMYQHFGLDDPPTPLGIELRVAGSSCIKPIAPGHLRISLLREGTGIVPIASSYGAKIRDLYYALSFDLAHEVGHILCGAASDRSFEASAHLSHLRHSKESFLEELIAELAAMQFISRTKKFGKYLDFVKARDYKYAKSALAALEAGTPTLEALAKLSNNEMHNPKSALFTPIENLLIQQYRPWPY